jgi:hypothetical protein
LDVSDKLLSPADIDTAIWAYWPDPVTELMLFKTIEHCMIHGPCRTANFQFLCMENGQCSKCYAKAFCETANLDP